MRVTDQPGRILAVTVIAPLLLRISICLRCARCSNAHRGDISSVLGVFAIIFFVYEMFWICFRVPKVAEFSMSSV